MTSETLPAKHPTLFQRFGHFLTVFAYLWLLLSVYTLHNSVVLSDWGLVEHIGAATLKALVFAKFVVIGEHLKLGRRAEGYPLIWPILIKAALFSCMLIGFNLLEEVLVEAIWPHAEPSSDILEMSDPQAILSLGFMAFIALIPFFGISELSKVIGQEKMHDLFFRKRTKMETERQG